jgi:hypothetical protein
LNDELNGDIIQVICKSDKKRQLDENITNYSTNTNLPLKYNSKKNRRYTPARVRNNKPNQEISNIKTPSKIKITDKEIKLNKNEDIVENTCGINNDSIVIKTINEQESNLKNEHDNN